MQVIASGMLLFTDLPAVLVVLLLCCARHSVQQYQQQYRHRQQYSSSKFVYIQDVQTHTNEVKQLHPNNSSVVNDSTNCCVRSASSLPRPSSVSVFGREALLRCTDDFDYLWVFICLFCAAIKQQSQQQCMYRYYWCPLRYTVCMPNAPQQEEEEDPKQL